MSLQLFLTEKKWVAFCLLLPKEKKCVAFFRRGAGLTMSMPRFPSTDTIGDEEEAHDDDDDDDDNRHVGNVVRLAPAPSTPYVTT